MELTQKNLVMQAHTTWIDKQVSHRTQTDIYW